MNNYININIMVNSRKTELKPTIKNLFLEVKKHMDLCLRGEEIHTIIFYRIGSKYRIVNMPVPPVDSIGLQLEQSFNDFMNELKISYSGVKLEGSMMIDTVTNVFVIGYNNYQKNGTTVTKKGHKIEGIF